MLVKFVSGPILWGDGPDGGHPAGRDGRETLVAGVGVASAGGTAGEPSDARRPVVDPDEVGGESREQCFHLESSCAP